MSALRTRNTVLLVIAVVFTVLFIAIPVPALLDDRRGGLVDAFFSASFRNPFAAGYSLDVWATGFALLTWIVYEARVLGVRRGWIAVILSFVPGVAVGLVAYLLIREPQLRTEPVAVDQAV